FYVSTPMIIIDGKRGPLKIGSLPLYQVPKLVLDLLNYDEPSIMDYTAAIPGLQVRPLPGLHFNVSTNGSVDTCKEPPYSDDCQLSARWLENVNIISNDLFIGRQFARPKHPMDPVSPAITAQLAPTIN
ncbi:MAG: LTA synthase family protein, partial [Methylococcaceae bacterium]|nr:LTA synthase family protein [Methylococcaceae bacterium]